MPPWKHFITTTRSNPSSVLPTFDVVRAKPKTECQFNTAVSTKNVLSPSRHGSIRKHAWRDGRWLPRVPLVQYECVMGTEYNDCVMLRAAFAMVSGIHNEQSSQKTLTYCWSYHGRWETRHWAKALVIVGVPIADAGISLCSEPH